MLIYKATNNLNGKIYIGQTRLTFKKKILMYYKVSNYKRKTRRLFIKALIKYGFNNFTFEQIDTANSMDELNEKEIMWIEFYQSTSRNLGYNLAIGGNGNILSIEHRHILSKALLGRRYDKETILNMSLSHIGKKLTSEKQFTNFVYSQLGKKVPKERREKIRRTLMGTHRTQETKDKLSISSKGNTCRAKLLEVTLPLGEKIIFLGLCKFSKEYNLPYCEIIKVANNKLDNYKGYKIKFLDREFKNPIKNRYRSD